MTPAPFAAEPAAPHVVAQVRGRAELKTKNFLETLHAA